MNSNGTLRTSELGPARIVPRWLHALSLTFVGLLLALVLVLVVSYVTAGPEENLAGVALILAGIVAVPLVTSLLLWATGCALRRRFPGLALALVVASALVSGFGVLLVAGWILPGL